MASTNDAALQTFVLDGRRYVVLAEEEYQRMREKAEAPALPAADASGNFPAIEAMRATLARGILHDRLALGLSRAEFARDAGISLRTLERIEQGNVTPSVPTARKIEQALEKAKGRQGTPSARHSK